jgi:multimeric flavodoxin WrbA
MPGGIKMGKVLIAHHHAGGSTEKMASYIGEGVRIGGHEADVKEIADIKSPLELVGYDGYIFGSPTYSLDVPENMKTFLIMAQQAVLDNKLGGAFGSYTHDVGYRHDNHAPAIIFESLQESYKMKPFDLGPLILREDVVDTYEGMRACQEYGRVFGHKLDG